MESREIPAGPSAETSAQSAQETFSAPSGERFSGMPEQRLGNAEKGESAPQAAAPPPPVVSPAIPAPTLPAPQHDTVQAEPTAVSSLTATDDGLIEKEWVDRAKKIVSQTKDNPYQQEKEVSKLQADYLKKRYGKEIKLNNN